MPFDEVELNDGTSARIPLLLYLVLDHNVLSQMPTIAFGTGSKWKGHVCASSIFITSSGLEA